MAESATGPMQLLAQLSALWQRQSSKRKLGAIAALVGILAIVGYTMFLQRPATWSSVSDGASPDDIQELYTTLTAHSIPARLRAGTIEVPTAKLDEARAVASAAGLPRAGKGFELFDKSSLGQSSFTEQINYRRALQGELARSITSLAQVEGARVHLALGKRSVFKDRDEPASASIALRLHTGQVLSAEQVRGIRQMVAGSVDGLAAEAVIVVDQHGNLLDGADPGSRDRKAELERVVTARVRNMLERVVGEGQVSVVATADVDDRQVSETQELFDPATQVVRSESRTIDGADPATMASGIAGTRGNLPGAPVAGAGSAGAGAGAGAGVGAGRIAETRNYEVSRTVRQTTKPDVVLQRIHLAIVVNHKASPDGKLVPRTAAELAELEALARNAGGLDAKRGDELVIRSLPFALDVATPDVAVAPAAPLPLLYLAAGGGALLLIGAITLFVVLRRRRNRKVSEETPRLALPVPIAELERALANRAALPAATEPEVPALPAGKDVRERVLETVRGNVERTASVLSGWLATAPTPGASSSSAPKEMKQ